MTEKVRLKSLSVENDMKLNSEEVSKIRLLLKKDNESFAQALSIIEALELSLEDLLNIFQIDNIGSNQSRKYLEESLSVFFELKEDELNFSFFR